MIHVTFLSVASWQMTFPNGKKSSPDTLSRSYSDVYCSKSRYYMGF